MLGHKAVLSKVKRIDSIIGYSLTMVELIKKSVLKVTKKLEYLTTET